MSCDVGEVTERLENEQSSQIQRYTAELILQPFRHFTSTHSPILPSLYLRHNSFSNPSVALPTSQRILQPFFRSSYVTSSSPTSQLILQPFHRFTYVTGHSPTLPLLHLRHSSFSNPSFASPTSQALHLMRRTHSPTFPSLYLRHSSSYNPSVASTMPQSILQPLFSFSYVTSSSINEQS